MAAVRLGMRWWAERFMWGLRIPYGDGTERARRPAASGRGALELIERVEQLLRRAC
ncbi:hypothetical protein GCM10010273_31690 [Streptomyces lavendulocolor]